MLELLCMACAAMAAYVWASPAVPADRLAGLLPRSVVPGTGLGSPAGPGAPQPSWPSHPPWPSAGRGSWYSLPPRALLPAAGFGLTSALLLGGVAGILAALLLTPVTAAVLARREPAERLRDRRRITADLPFAADLMAACLLAGQPAGAATDIAATAVGGPLGHRLAWVGAQLRLGADPEPTWAHLAHEPATAQLARTMIRAAQSGAPVAEVLTRLANDARETSRAASVAAARSVGVKAVAPLGLCFLPAFVLLGIVPVVAGLATAVVIP